jgi:hypothetical protein
MATQRMRKQKLKTCVLQHAERVILRLSVAVTTVRSVATQSRGNATQFPSTPLSL